MPNLDYAELEAAVEAIVCDLVHKTYLTAVDIGVIRNLALAAFQAIATRAFEQAARLDAGKMVIDEPPVPLSDACAALDKPKEPAR